MNICSCVVHTRPQHGPTVGAALAQLPGVELHGGSDAGKLVITVEDTDTTQAADTLSALHTISGVINTVLIYHYGGDDLALSLPHSAQSISRSGCEEMQQ